jgi:hypothetical protein
MPETVPYIISHIQLDTYNFSVIPELESGKNIILFLVVKDTSWKFIH